MSHPDIIIIGSGLIGTATALFLARSIWNLLSCSLRVREVSGGSVCSGTGTKLTGFVCSLANFVFQ